MSLPIEPKVENQGLTQHGRLTAAEFNLLLEQINKNTPQPVASEEALKQMIQDGSIVEGQMYYIPEE